MKRVFVGVGIAVVALAGAVAASQAQAPRNPQGGIGPDGGRPEFHCGPLRGDGPGAGMQHGQEGQRPQGAMRGRGPGGGRQGGLGRPGGPGGRRGGFDRELCALGLTEAQQAQIAAIHEKARLDVEAVLTAEQKEKLQALRAGRGTEGRR